MKFKNLLKIIFSIFLICQLASGSLVNKNAEKQPEGISFCMHSTCGWQIDKANALTEYVENHCKCKTNEQCVRTAKEYRLPGWKYHCRRPEDLKDNVGEIILFPNLTKNNQPVDSQPAPGPSNDN